MKRYFKQRRFNAWFFTTAIVIPIMITVLILVCTAFYAFLTKALGREIAIYEEGKEPRFVAEAASKEDAYERANNVNERICEEGFVLLKNADGALPLKDGAKISVFGKNSVRLVYGGSGSSGGNKDGIVKLHDALREAGFAVNPELETFYGNNRRSGAGRSDNPTDLDSGADVSLDVGETAYSLYDDALKRSYGDYNDVALIVLSRIGGEGFDLPRQSTDDASRHYLELDPREKELIRNVTQAGFKKVVLLLNSAAVMELGFVESGELGNIDACLYIGAPGNGGISALGKILKGEVNPSGKTVDTWAADLLSAPSIANFGSNFEFEGDAYLVPNAKGDIPTDSSGNPVASGYFVGYEEGIYIGYRYYETRAAAYDGAVTALKESVYGSGEAWYKANVVYPFGYGLSYTTFTQSIDNKSALENTSITKDGKITVKVSVKNTGSAPGKDVVQIYAAAPYTPGGIEKAHKVLVGFAKTATIPAGESRPVEIEIDPYDFASYDYSGKKDPSYKGYILEAGSYTFTLGKNAHEAYDSFGASLSADVRYDVDPDTKNPVVNRFDDAAEELDGVLSRSAWSSTFPVKPTYESRIKTQEFIDSIESTETNNPETFGAPPTVGAPVKLTLFDLIEADDYKGYDDERWDDILDSLTVDEMANLVNNGAFTTQAIIKIGKSATIDADGPSGFTIFLNDPSVYGTCSYASEVIMASTYNAELVYEMGECVGEEGLWGNQAGDKTTYSGWYAPGVNLHRNPFGGRNFEYFSEDGFLSGKLAAAEIRGCASKGVYTFMKHFAVNEQETHRSLTGLCTYLTEQALRELYLKPFEIAVKDGKATGIMSSFNRIGKTWTGGDYRLLNDVLRSEWGFVGTVISDFNTNYYMNPKQMVYAGGDLNLATLRQNMWTNYSASSASDVTVLRKAAKNILYTVSCSNSMNAKIARYLPPLWLDITIVVMAAITVGLAVWGVFAILYAKKAIKAEQAGGGDSSDKQSE